ncbi:MAG: hypothetical protein WCS25_05660, partial [Victivallaceae bacterium]
IFQWVIAFFCVKGGYVVIICRPTCRSALLYTLINDFNLTMEMRSPDEWLTWLGKSTAPNDYRCF